MTFLSKVVGLYDRLSRTSDRYFSPVLDLGIRLFMAKIFFDSGMLKFENYLNGRWEDTVEAFTDYHPVPYLDPEMAAVLGTGGEVILPVMLALGLGGRFAAAGLLAMTMVIEFAVPADYELRNFQHYMWMLLLAVPFLKGPGTLSLDFLLKKYVFKKQA